MDDIENKYRELYEKPSFRNIYLQNRSHLYLKVVGILKGLGCPSLLDIGCSYGLLVEMANSCGIDAWGLDFDIGYLRDFHSQLKHSSSKFLYGSVADKAMISRIRALGINTLVILDVLRYFDNPIFLNELDADLIAIKDNSSSFISKFIRNNGFNLRSYSPADWLLLFAGYQAIRIYSSKFLIRINNPGGLVLSLLNLFSPTYTLILKKIT